MSIVVPFELAPVAQVDPTSWFWMKHYRPDRTWDEIATALEGLSRRHPPL